MAQDIVDLIREGASRFGVSPTTMLAIAKRESGLNPNAKNPASSAGGLMQFIDGTWAKTVAKYGNAVGLGPDASRYDPKAAAFMGAALAAENREVIKALVGRDASEGELYAAHFLGGKGAVNMILAAERTPDAPAAALFPAAAVANPSIFYDKEGMPRPVSAVYANLTSIDGSVAEMAGAPKADAKPADTAAADEAVPDFKFATLSPVPAAVQRMAPSGAKIESEIERVAARVGAPKGLLG